MLKKYQVLVPLWLEDYIKYLVDKYDLKFSELIRTEVCFSILCTVTHLYPEYKSGITPEEILVIVKDKADGDMEKEEMYRVLSKIYFEARKAAEYRLANEKRPKKQ